MAEIHQGIQQLILCLPLSVTFPVLLATFGYLLYCCLSEGQISSPYWWSHAP